MKVLFINKTYESGGAAIAARQIAEAVKHDGVEVSFLVQEEPNPQQKNVVSTCKGFGGKIKQFGLFVLERLMFLSTEKSKRLRYAFAPAFTGEDISSNTLVKSCDIIHIHWFNQGYISLKGLENLIKLGKPIVWTLHDMWAFTGGCHYAWDCSNYIEKCGNCQFLKNATDTDLSAQMWIMKSAMYKADNMVFVPVSKWLNKVSLQSSLGKSIPNCQVYNPIDTELFKLVDKLEARKKLNLNANDKYILFGASRIDDRIKGIKYFIEALKLIDSDYKVVIFGGQPKFDKTVLNDFPVEVKYIGSVAKSEQAIVYSACDVTCVPSEYETFGLVAAEAMACGCPVVAFDNSGVAEVVDHMQNGYLARHRSAEDLGNGLEWVLNHDTPEELSRSARIKVKEAFGEEKIGKEYAALYKDLMKKGQVSK